MSKLVIAFILTYVSGLAATIFVDVAWGIYLYQLQYFLNPVARWWYSHLPHLRYSFIIAIFIFISFIIRNKQYAENRLFDVPQTKWLAVFLIMMIGVSFYAVWPEVHSKTMVHHLKLFFFMAIAYKVIDTPGKFEKMIWAFLVGNFYVGYVSHSIGRTGFGRLEDTGPADTGGDGNATAAILLSAVPILLFYVLKGKKWQKFLSLAFLAFILDSIILINSRGAFLGLVVSMAYMGILVFFSRSTSSKERYTLLGMMFAGICLFVYLTDVTFWERMATIITESESDMGGGGRKFFWIKTFDLVSQHPFGVGVWGYQKLSPQFIDEAYLTNGMRDVHSTYFQCFADYGYLGVPMLCGLLLSNFRFIRKIKQHLIAKGETYLYYQTIAIESGFVGYLVSAVFLSLLYPEVLYWFMLFFACSGNIYMLKEKQVPGATA